MENKDLLKNIIAWIECRRNLINILESSALQLDRNLKIASYGRFIGSSVELANSFNFGFFESFHRNIADLACTISPALGFVTETVIHMIPQLGHMGLVSCFGEIAWSKAIIKKVKKSVEEDMDKFESIKQWYTEELDDSIKQLFPYGIDLNIVKSIEKSLPEFDIHAKVFSSIFFSNVSANPDLFSDGNFLSKLLLFCSSKPAKEWFERITNPEHPIYIEYSKLFFEKEVQELVELSVGLEPFIEIGKVNMNLTTVPRVFRGVINIISMYSAVRDLKNDTKHKASETLRDMKRIASEFLTVMNDAHLSLSLPIIDLSQGLL